MLILISSCWIKRIAQGYNTPPMVGFQDSDTLQSELLWNMSRNMIFPAMWYVRPAYVQSDQSLCLSLEYSMIVKLLTEHQLRFLSLKGGCTGSSECTLVKMPLLEISRHGSYWFVLLSEKMCHIWKNYGPLTVSMGKLFWAFADLLLCHRYHFSMFGLIYWFALPW